MSMACVALVAFAGCGDDDGDRLESDDLPGAPAALRVSSPDFTQDSLLRERNTCDGAGDEPRVFATPVPTSVRELVLVVTDPDAPGGTFVHVTRFGIPNSGNGAVHEGGSEGENSGGETGWTPPCPPKGDKPHRYVWSVYALSEESGLTEGAKPAEVTAALKDGVLAAGTLTGRYGR
jgi:Raf kinase inhibitor-like YbhB/YbcL family protein